MIALGMIFEAVEMQTRSQHPALAVGSPEYNAHVRDVFEQVILDTQPTYNRSTRSEAQTEEAFKWLAMFASQRTKNYSMIADAYYEGMHTGNYMRMGKALAVVSHQAAWIAALRGIVEAGTMLAIGKAMFDGSDDDDDPWWYVFMRYFTTSTMGTIASNIPLIGNTIDRSAQAYAHNWDNGPSLNYMNSKGGNSAIELLSVVTQASTQLYGGAAETVTGNPIRGAVDMGIGALKIAASAKGLPLWQYRLVDKMLKEESAKAPFKYDWHDREVEQSPFRMVK